MDRPKGWDNILLQEGKKSHVGKRGSGPLGPRVRIREKSEDGGTEEGLHEQSSGVKSKLCVFGLLQPAECFWGVE